MSLPQIRSDWAQHMVYGGWVGASGAATVLMLDAVVGRPGLSLLAPVASLLAALVAGLVKEVVDDVLNNRARSRALAKRIDEASNGRSLLLYQVPAPHEVSATDVVATLTGALPVAIPLFISLWT